MSETACPGSAGRGGAGRGERALAGPGRGGQARVAFGEEDIVDRRPTRPPALWRRAAAALVDAAVLAAVVAVLWPPGAQPPVQGLAGLLVPAAALAMFYRVLSEGSRLAATPGKLLLGLRVAQEDGGPVSFATAAVRAWPWWLTGAVAGIAPSAVPVAAALCLAALAPIPLSASRRGLHDRMARASVVDNRHHATGGKEEEA